MPKAEGPISSKIKTISNTCLNNGNIVCKPQTNLHQETLANFITFYNSNNKQNYNYNIENNKSKENDNANEKEEPDNENSKKKILSPADNTNNTKKQERGCETRQTNIRSIHQMVPSQLVELAEDDLPRAVHCDKLFIIKANNLITTSYNMCKETQLPQINSKKEIYKPYKDQEKNDPRILLSRGKMLSKG